MKRILSLLLVTAMFLAMTACGKQPTGGTNSTDSITSTDSTISTDPTTSTDSTVSTDSETSTDSTPSADSTASTNSTASTVSTNSTNSTTSTTSTPSTTPTTSTPSTTPTSSTPTESKPVEIPDEKPTLDYSILRGITLYAFGDSYIQGHTLGTQNTWSALLAREYDMTYGNYGLNGSAVSTVSYGRAPMIERYTQIPTGGDIIMVVGGRNDYNQRVTLGTVNDTNNSTFAGALNELIINLKAAHPDTLILFGTPWYVNEDLKKYSDMMLAVCAKHNVPCFNAADQSLSGVYMTDAQWRKSYCMSDSDTDHLNAEGMKLVLGKYEKFILTEYTRYLGN